MDNIRIFAEVLPTSLGRAMYRINDNLKKYAPSWVQFTKNQNEADIQIIDIIGLGSFEFIYKKDYIVFQHCFLSSESASPDTWLPVFQKAKLTVSYMDLFSLVKSDNFNFLRIPWGVDPTIFHKLNAFKMFTILTTGYVAYSESIQEILDAITITKGSMVHVGGDLNLPGKYKRVEGITDEQMNSLYCSSKFVNGLRKTEGFELPIIEGLLCGARGICYNKDHYRYWYGDLVEYVDEDDNARVGAYSETTKNQLINIFNRPYRRVTDEEIQRVKDTFSWEVICKKFWDRFTEIA